MAGILIFVLLSMLQPPLASRCNRVACRQPVAGDPRRLKCQARIRMSRPDDISSIVSPEGIKEYLAFQLFCHLSASGRTIVSDFYYSISKAMWSIF